MKLCWEVTGGRSRVMCEGSSYSKELMACEGGMDA